MLVEPSPPPPGFNAVCTLHLAAFRLGITCLYWFQSMWSTMRCSKIFILWLRKCIHYNTSVVYMELSWAIGVPCDR